MIYDILIKNGFVIDGKLGKIRKQNIGIKDGEIKYIGDLAVNEANEIINAEGWYVSPGFIDLTTHSDTHWTLFNEPGQESFITQGITTILGGNCGFSLAPLANKEVIEGVQKWVDPTQLNVSWQNFNEFLGVLEKRGLALNFASLIGLGTLRRNILANENRNLTNSELQEMFLLLDKTLEEGAFGLSTSLGRIHEKDTSSYELEQLFKIVKKHDGLTKHHLRSEGKEIISSVSEIIGFLRETKVKTQLSHFKILGRQSWSNFDQLISMIEHARNEEKLDLWLDFSPYEKTGSNLYLLLPAWLLSGGKNEVMLKLKQPEIRKNVIDYLKTLTLHYDKITIASTLRDNLSFGKTIQYLADKTGLRPEEVILDLLNINEFKVSIFSEVIDPKHLDILALKDYSLFASDGVGESLNFKNYELPHPRSFGAMPRSFRLFTREKRILTLEETVYKMTGLPALNLGLKDRGEIAPGKKADLVIFDPEKIQDKADYQNPFRQSEGIHYVFVNGRAVVSEGKTTLERPGAVLRK